MKNLTAILMLFVSFSAHCISYGIDRLEVPEVATQLAGKKLAVLTHAAAKSKQGIHLIDSLHKNFELKKIFAPEHGLRTMADDWVEDGTDEATGLPVISLYKRGSRAPLPQDLKGIEAVVIDLQDVGVRYYTYFSTIAEVMKVCAALKIEVILLDRPNLLGGLIMEGKVLDAALAGSFIAYHTIPTRHGMTLGELARMVNQENKLGAKLSVIPVEGWQRENLLHQSDRPWISPSPALVEIEQVGLYALWGALEHFNLSVGRGKTNELAFRVIGAPWISAHESEQLSQALNRLALTGVKFRPHHWQVERAIFAGQLAHGVYLQWDGQEVASDEFLYQVTRELMKLFKERLIANHMAPLAYGSPSMLENLRQLKTWQEYRQQIQVELEKFKNRRQGFLLY